MPPKDPEQTTDTATADLGALGRLLNARALLDDKDLAAVLGLPHTIRTVEAGTELVQEGTRPDRCSFMLTGFACRQKVTSHGGRQIVGLLVPGDFSDLQQIFLRTSDHAVCTLTRATIADFAVSTMRHLATAYPQVGRAMWLDALVDASIFREWLLNLGRRDARGRVAHLLCELAVRLRAVDLVEDDWFDLPMSQEQLGDTLGLTSVHINRILRDLTEEGAIQRQRRRVGIGDWKRLCAIADFNPRYLHLDQTSADD